MSDQNSSPLPLPAMSKEDIENEGARADGDTTDGYKETEDESEEDFYSFDGDTTVSTPATPSTIFKTEDSSQKWVMATLWDTNTSLFIKRGLRVIGAGKNHGKMLYTRKEFISIINKALDKLDTGNVHVMTPESDFILVYIIPQPMPNRYSRYSEDFQAEVVQINVMNAALYPGTALKRCPAPKELVTSIFATGKLADVFSSAIDISDLLIITGGYYLEPTPDGIECVLISEGQQKTEVIRIQTNWHAELETVMSLMETIEPASNRPKERYKFTYSARQGTVLNQTVRFSKILAHCWNVIVTPHWNFPMPILPGTNPQLIFKRLISPKFSTLLWDNPVQVQPPQEETESENNEDTFMTANVSAVDLSPKKPLNLPSPLKKCITFEELTSDSSALEFPKSQTNLPPQRYQALTNSFFSKEQNSTIPLKKDRGSRKKPTESEGDKGHIFPKLTKAQMIIIIFLLIFHLISLYALLEIGERHAAKVRNEIPKIAYGANEETLFPTASNQVKVFRNEVPFASGNDNPYPLFFRYICNGKRGNEVAKELGQNKDWMRLSFWTTALIEIGDGVVNSFWILTCWLKNNLSLENILTKLGFFADEVYTPDLFL